MFLTLCPSPRVLTELAFSAKMLKPQGRREIGDALSSPSLVSSSKPLSTGYTPQQVVVSIPTRLPIHYIPNSLLGSTPRTQVWYTVFGKSTGGVDHEDPIAG